MNEVPNLESPRARGRISRLSRLFDCPEIGSQTYFATVAVE